jgi:hypothetical protein
MVSLNPPRRYWPTLESELQELERTDPTVKAAAESYDRMVLELTADPTPQPWQVIALFGRAFDEGCPGDWLTKPPKPRRA